MTAPTKSPEELRAELAADLDMLRDRGVKLYEHGPNGVLKVELFPPAVEAAGDEQKPVSSKCRCGHESYEHGEGLCLRGCDPVKCAPPEKST